MLGMMLLAMSAVVNMASALPLPDTFDSSPPPSPPYPPCPAARLIACQLRQGWGMHPEILKATVLELDEKLFGEFMEGEAEENLEVGDDLKQQC